VSISSKRSRAQQAAALAQAALQHQRAGRLQPAVEHYERARQLAPAGAGLLCNLGEAYRALGQKTEALQILRQACSLAPEAAAIHFNVGLVLDQLGRFGEAAEAYARAVELEPSLANAAVFLLQALRDDAQLERAARVYDELQAQVPESADLHRAIGNVLADLFRIDEALPHFLEALELEPRSGELWTDYAAALVERGEVREAVVALRRALELEPTLVRAHSSLVYLLAFVPDATPEAIRDEAHRFGALHTRELPRPAVYTNVRDARRKLRVGYVSPDFRAHPVASFLPEVLHRHERSDIEVYCYANVRKPDSETARLRELSDAWRDIALLSDDEAARVIAHDRIDVLVDLAMHSGGGRPQLFGRKPAPVQLCWLAYPGTTGITGMDYRLSDSILDPAGTRDELYTERTIRLRDCFWCYAPPAGAHELTPLPALAAGTITFGSPNSFKKVSTVALELWARVASAVRGSRMLIVSPAGQAWQRVEAAFAEGGVASSRLERLPHTTRGDYLAAIRRMDCVLDCVPYNGGTSTFDALHCGVPVLTLLGTTASGRAGASIAHHLGLPELVAETPEQLLERAGALAADLPGLERLRYELRARLEASPLMDSKRFARSLETAYREAFERWATRDV
jgi:protein O-GlcNAc transferase